MQTRSPLHLYAPAAEPMAKRENNERDRTAGLLQTVGDGAMTQPPFADEGLAAGFDFLERCRIGSCRYIVIRLFMTWSPIRRSNVR
jgi:hypothetical protein